MGKKKPSLGEVLGGAAMATGVTGTAVALSSDTTAELMSMAWDGYAEAYGDGTGFKAGLMRAAPGAAATAAATGLMWGADPMKAGVIGALGLAGTAIGAMSGPVKRNIGDGLAEQIMKDGAGGTYSGMPGRGGTYSGMPGRGGPRRRRAPGAAQQARAMARLTRSTNYTGGAPVRDIAVGGNQARNVAVGGLANLDVG